MRVKIYPDDGEKRDILHHLYKELRRQPDLFSLVKKTMERVEKMKDLDMLSKEKWAGRLKGTKYSIFEFRIPPRRRGGVVRIYFSYFPMKKDTIILLSAELKKKSKANPEKIREAEKRYLEVGGNERKK